MTTLLMLVFLSPMIGSGVSGDPYRPALSSYTGTWTAIIPSKADGTPRFSWACVDTPDTGLVADSTHLKFPVMARSSVLTNAHRLVINAVAAKYGFDAISPGRTYQEAVEAICGILQPGFSPGYFFHP